MKYTVRRRRTAPAAACVSSARQGQGQPAAQVADLSPQRPLRETERQLRVLLDLPEVTARPSSRTSSTRNSCSRSSNTGRVFGCGETPASNYSRNCSAIGRSSPMPPGARRFTAATCRRPLHHEPGRPRPGLVELGGSRTMPSSGWPWLAVDQQRETAVQLLMALADCDVVSADLSAAILSADQSTKPIGA